MVKIIILHLQLCFEAHQFFYVKQLCGRRVFIEILPFQHGCMEGGQQNIADFFLYDKIVKFCR